MARRITIGTVGDPILGTLKTDNNTITTVNNTSITLTPSGTGTIDASASVKFLTGKSALFYDADGSNYVDVKAPSISSNVTFQLPNSNGTNGYTLVTNGSGVTSWANTSVAISNNTVSSSTFYPSLVDSSSGSMNTIYSSSSKLSYIPSSGMLTTVGLTATTVSETSSIVYKENINPINNALDSILNLVGVIYDRKDGSTKNEAGLIAEEVDKVLPNLVMKDETGKPESIMYTKLTAYLIEAVKSLKAEIDSLKDDK